MSEFPTVATSPLFFLHPQRDGQGAFEALQSRHFGPPSLELIEMIHFFCEPQPISAGISAGYSAENIRAALDAGILRDVGDEVFTRALLWEDRRWSRAAFLNFLKRDQSCPRQNTHNSSVALTRSEQDADPMRAAPFPARRLVACDSPIALPAVPEEVPIDLDAVVRRRCVRSYSDEPTSLDAFASILFESTRSYRESERRRGARAPEDSLDTNLAWLQVYVVVQRVAGVDRGVYQYDPLANNLRFAGPNKSDNEIIASVHGQWWVRGGGFCLFAVADWARFMGIDQHARAYLDLLVQIGEFSQELLFPVARVGLGAWMTPAINETAAACLLCLDGLAQDAVFFMKIGPPQSA